MNGLKYRWIIYFIGGVILATLCIQGYWNYKNYQTSKQQLVNDVQTSLDNAVDHYFTQLAAGDTFRISKDSLELDLLLNNHIPKRGDSVRIVISDSTREFAFHELRPERSPNVLSMMKSKMKDTTDSYFIIDESVTVDGKDDSIVTIFEKISRPVAQLSSKIMVSFSNENLSLSKVDSLFQEELKRKSIDVDYGLSHTELLHEKEELRPEIIDISTLEVVSKSPYFFYNNNLKAHFTDLTFAVLQKNIWGMLLSFLLVASVIACLLYLLKIINRQKELAEVKNDLISNITHEFKTPIATIGAAMEGIRLFNTENDTEKNLRYAKISGEQVEKLNAMVEKLLETATLDSDQLSLNFEKLDLVELLRKAIAKETFIIENKKFSFDTSDEQIAHPIDGFHFENAINNIIDNALKYGGENISVAIKKLASEIEISISDSGTSLSEEHKKHIFEKFYRVPKGNTHDVKGFGIGLYYSRKIIEKHGGSISLQTTPQTTFKIRLPHV